MFKNEYPEEDDDAWDEWDDEDVYDYEYCWEPPKPPYDYLKPYVYASNAFKRIEDDIYGHGPIWWIPMEGWDPKWGIEDEIETEDFKWGNTFVRTDIVNARTYLTRTVPQVRFANPFASEQLKKWRIHSYYQVWVGGQLDGSPRYTAIMAYEPPPWGWWMPSLTPNVVL